MGPGPPPPFTLGGDGRVHGTPSYLVGLRPLLSLSRVSSRLGASYPTGYLCSTTQLSSRLSPSVPRSAASSTAFRPSTIASGLAPRWTAARQSSRSPSSTAARSCREGKCSEEGCAGRRVATVSHRTTVLRHGLAAHPARRKDSINVRATVLRFLHQVTFVHHGELPRHDLNNIKKMLRKKS